MEYNFIRISHANILLLCTIAFYNTFRLIRGYTKPFKTYNFIVITSSLIIWIINILKYMCVGNVTKYNNYIRRKT